MAVVLIVTGVLSAVLLISDKKEADRPVTEIRRNTYGQGSITRTLQVVIDGVKQREPLEITVEERRYTEEEMQKVFESAIEKLDSAILGTNRSLDEVYSDLNLITEIPGEPVEVAWELDRYDLMSIYGELNQENLRKEKEGILIHLKAWLTYTEDESVKVLEETSAMVYPPQLSKEAAVVDMVKAAIEQKEEESREEESVSLPSEIGGKKVQLRSLANFRGWYVFLLGIVICVLLMALEKQNHKKEEEDRKQQMMLDYPEIVNKLTLLLGAGITVKSAWQKIVQDYERQKVAQGTRYAFEEMAVAYHEMQSGFTEAESYERFGKRCGLRAYRKLAAYLTQNLRKGTKGLTNLLSIEAGQAFEERKATAKKRGEEAGTKLLAPMFLMLATVLVMVIVPAFLSIQM